MSGEVVQIKKSEMSVEQINHRIDQLRHQLCEMYRMRRGRPVPHTQNNVIYCIACGISQVNVSSGQDTCPDCQHREGM